MEKNKMRCIRCKGRKRLYRVASGGYSYTDTGGKEVDCPMCLGEGVVKTLESAAKEVEEKRANSKGNQKESEDGKETKSSSNRRRKKAQGETD